MNKNKLVIVGIGLLLSVIVYSSFTSMSKSNNSSKDYEYYYNDEENTNNTEEFDSNDTVPALARDTNPTNTIPIAINAPMNTDPETITVFVNKEYDLPKDYVPSDLVEPNVTFSFNYSDEKRLLRKEAAYAFENLFHAASSDGYTICGVSAYRSYARQNSIYNRNLNTKGEDYTNRYSAKPGYSEHQTGLSIDVSATSIGNRLSESFADTEEGKWLAEHAHEYGYIIRYPQEKSDITGYAYEPWHIRYLGIELATYLYENNLTLEEYYNYTPPVKDEDSTDNYDNAIDVDEADDNLIDEISKPNKSTPNPNTNVDTNTEPSNKDNNPPKEDNASKDTPKDSNTKDTNRKDTDKDSNKDIKSDSKSDTKSDSSNKSDSTNKNASDSKKTDSNTSNNGSDLNPSETTPNPSNSEGDSKPTDSMPSDTGPSSPPEDTTNGGNSDTGNATDDTSNSSDAGVDN